MKNKVYNTDKPEWLSDALVEFGVSRAFREKCRQAAKSALAEQKLEVQPKVGGSPRRKEQVGLVPPAPGRRLTGFGLEQSKSVIGVLAVAAAKEDRFGLSTILNDYSSSLPEALRKLEASPSLQSASRILEERKVAIVVCQADLEDTTWKHLLEVIKLLPYPPSLIVASRVADENLWAEALTLGAYDVLAKPFLPDEVIRVLSSAWLRWEQQQRHQKPECDAETSKNALDWRTLA